MTEGDENINPLTQKKRKTSNGTPLGDATEAFHGAKTREDKFALLKGNAELAKHFRLGDYAPTE